jgi:hypothetical protein
LPICDPHHHLWDHPPAVIGGHRYLIDELIVDTGSGHNVTSTVLLLVSRPWNSSTRIAEWFGPGDKTALFHDTAVRAYRLDGEAGAGA